MDCPRCHSPTIVVEKRPGDRRRRECTAEDCLYRFTTYELQAEDLQRLQDASGRLDKLRDLLKEATEEDLAETRPLDLELPS